MELDRTALSRLLALNDAQLKYVVGRFAREYGIDLSGYAVTDGDIASVRRAIANLSDEQISAIAQRISGGRK